MRIPYLSAECWRNISISLIYLRWRVFGPTNLGELYLSTVKACFGRLPEDRSFRVGPLAATRALHFMREDQHYDRKQNPAECQNSESI